MERDAGGESRPTVGRKTALVGLTAGHGVIHWYAQSFFIILPEIARGMGLSPVQVGAVTGVRQITGGSVNLPAGILADALRRYTSFILAIAIAWIALAYVFVGFAATYALVLVGMALVGIGSSLWHPPAMGTLGRLWSDRRGFALSVHGVGASIGDTVAPMAVGALLMVINWRDLLKVGFVPGLVVATAIAWGLRGIYAQGKVEKRASGTYLDGMRGLLRNFPLLTLILASGVRAMGQTTFSTFLPIYLRQDLEFSTARVGLYLGLLTFMGAGSQPLLGLLSDRIGRKPVMVPSLVILSVLVLLLVWAQPGWQLTLILLAMGIFFYSLGSIVMAMNMDIAGRNVESTAAGLLFGSNLLFGAAAPVIAGVIIGASNTKAAFVYVAAVQAVSAVAFLILPQRRAAALKETAPAA